MATKKTKITKPKTATVAKTASKPAETTQPLYDTTTIGAYSFQSFVSFINDNFVVLLIVGLAFIGGFVAGSLWTENQMLKAGSFGSGVANKPAAFAEQDAPVGPTADQLAAMPAITDADHAIGPKNAKVTLVEYSDFQCPFCQTFHPTLQAMKEKYGNDIRWVYRHFPLDAIHPDARPMAIASECVAKLGGNDAFWKYSDALFAAATPVTAQTMVKLAADTTGLSESAVQGCVDAGEVEAKVDADQTGGAAAGITGTPGTIVISADGQYELISGAVPAPQVEQILKKYL